MTFVFWLFTLARNAAYDFLWQRRCRPETVANECLLREIPEPGGAALIPEIMEALERALTCLSPKDRRLVLLVVHGVSYRTAARREGLSIGAVKVRLNRVRPFLRLSVGGAIGRPSKAAGMLPRPPRCRAAA